MPRLRFLALPIGCLAAPAIAGPQSDGQAWLNANAAGPIAGRLRASGEVTTRIGHASSGLYEVEMVALLGVDLGHGATLWGGFVHDPTYLDGHPIRTEERFREQVTAPLGTLAGGKLSGRMRIEQRWIDGRAGTGWRVRPWLRWSLPVARTVALNLSHESFIDLNATGWGQRAGYDRMRNTITLSHPIARGVSLEGGYLNQYSFRPGRDQIAHVATLALGYSW